MVSRWRDVTAGNFAAASRNAASAILAALTPREPDDPTEYVMELERDIAADTLRTLESLLTRRSLGL